MATRKTKDSVREGESEISFEQAIEQLETITRQLEGGALSLDESIRAYEKGMELRKICQEMLARAEKKLEYLERRADGTLVKKAIETDDDEQAHTDQNRLFQE